jgi:hypothetical protein
MKQFVLTMGNRDVVFDIYDTNIAKLWAWEINKQYPFYETDRFQGWPNDTRDLDWYKTNLQIQIDKVNAYKLNTIEDSIAGFDQEVLNRLHKHFEVLRGSLEDGTDFYNNAPVEVKGAIDKFNILIHECEHFMRDYTHPSIVVTFKDRPRMRLHEEDYEHFTYKWQFGTVYINYCEVGKPILDVFKDNDIIVGDDNIRPLEYYSADFMIKFGPSTDEAHYLRRQQALDTWLATQEHSFTHLSLGLIPVATLNREQFAGLSDSDIVNELSLDRTIRAVCIK